MSTRLAPLPAPLRVRLLPRRPACPVPWPAVAALLTAAHDPAVLAYALTLEPDGTIHYIPTGISRGWWVEPSAPVIVRHYGDCPPSSPARHAAALAAYQQTLEAAGYTCRRYDCDWSMYLAVLAGPATQARP